MSTVIRRRVEAARRDGNPQAVCRLDAGWVVMGDVQPVTGAMPLLPDPVVPSLNDLHGQDRADFLSDVVRLGDLLLETADAARINYDIRGS